MVREMQVRKPGPQYIDSADKNAEGREINVIFAGTMD